MSKDRKIDIQIRVSLILHANSKPPFLYLGLVLAGLEVESDEVVDRVAKQITG